jgi:flagellar basal body-associated protein FliL
MRSSPVLAALLLAALLAAPARAGDGASDGGKAPKHKVTQSESYLMIDPMYSAILDGDRPVGLLMIGVGLDIPDAKLRGEAEHAMPVLRDAFVRNMLNYSTTSVRPWRQPDVVQIADRLQGVADRALGRKGAKVLLAQVAIRVTK